MNPIDMIYQSLGVMTNGLISDLTTLILGIVVLMFLGMAIDLLKVVMIDKRVTNNKLIELRKLHNKLGLEGTADEALKMQRYRKILRELKDYKEG